MAITFKGTAKSYTIFGNDNTAQNIFTIENKVASRVNMNIRRFVLQDDTLAVSSGVMPMAKLSRATGISGGVILEKSSFDTLLSSDPNVIIRAQMMETAYINATAGGTIWQQFLPRLASAAEQPLGIDNNLLPLLVSNTGKEFVLRPGESLLVKIIAANVAYNAATAFNYFVQCVWEEVSLSTFAISGTVTIGGTPVEGAIVTVIEADDESMTNARLIQVVTTNASGQWSSSIRTGKIGAALVQYKSGGIYYTAPGSPFISGG